MDDAIFMTGATGFIGSHFLYRALCEQVPVYCLVRAKDRATGYRRLHAALEAASSAYEEGDAWRTHTRNLRVIIGDITLEECGVQASLLDSLRGNNLEFWHFAGNQRYEDKAREAIYRDNVRGTCNALAVATKLGITRFVQMSAAYTAGTASGQIAERLHPLDGAFQNHYESSKCRAEHEVYAWGQKHGKDIRIARPSIVVGPQRTYMPGGGNAGFYAFMRELFRLRRSLPDATQSLVTLGESSTPLNLIPVDRVVDELLALRRFGFPCGPIYHLTSDSCPNLGHAVAAAAKAAGVPRLRLANKRKGPASSIELALDQRTRFYSSYFASPKRFERRVCAGAKLSATDLSRYCEGFAAELRRRNPLSLFEWRNVQTDDEVQLRTYVAGQVRRPAVILVNSFGMSAESMVELAARLTPRYRVITWRPRGLDAVSEDADCSLDRHVRDLGLIMSAYELRRAHVVGWCTGADVALAFAQREPTRAMSLTLLNGALLRGTASETRFQRRLRILVAGASRSLEHAHGYYEALSSGKISAARDALQRVERVDTTREHYAGLLDDVDPEFLHLMSRPFVTPQAMHRYARCMQTFIAESGAKWPEQPLNMPVLVVTGSADSIANAEASRIFARRLNAELLDLPGGDHFAHARRPEVAEAMMRIMASPSVRFKVRNALQKSRRQNQARRPGATSVLRALDGGLP